MATPFDPQLLIDAIKAALVAEFGATKVFVSEVTTVPLDTGDNRPSAHVVLHPTPGSVRDDRLAGIPAGDIVFTASVTCVGGDVFRAMRAVQKARKALTGLRTPGTGLLTEWDTYSPPPVQVDRASTPPTWFTVLQFRAHAAPPTI